MVTQAHPRDELLTVKEAAARLRVHPQSVRRMIEDGRLRAFQLGGPGTAVRIDARELEAWLVSQLEGDPAA